MRTLKTVIAAVIAIAVLVSAGTYVYINVLKEDAPAPLAEGTTASPSPDDSPAVALPEVTGEWSVASPSQVGYRVKEVLFGQSTEGVGRTTKVTGTLTADATNITKADFTVDMTSLKSDSDRRDGQVNGRILATSTNPTSTFTLTTAIALPSVPTATGYAVKATGDLRLHGVTKSVTADLTMKATGDKVTITGAIPIVFEDYNIPNPSLSGISVEDHGILELSLTFAKE